MKNRIMLLVALVVLGASWGITIPLTKIAVSTGHQAFGLVFWQFVIVLVLLGGITLLRGKRLAFGRQYMRLFFMVALFGALVPDVLFFIAATKLPAGVLSIILAAVPMFSLIIAIMLGNDQFAWRRLFGLMLGMCGILLLIGPDASLTTGALSAYVLLALLVPVFYATEGNLVALWGTQDLDAVQTLVGASAVGVVLSLPLALVTGQWVNPLATFGAAEAALVSGSLIHGLVYAAFVWLVQRAGPVFASQTSYLVNGFGVFWAIVLLGERYSGWVWAAMALMLTGVFLVQPKPRQRATPATAAMSDAP